jgi:hypothetical protein
MTALQLAAAGEGARASCVHGTETCRYLVARIAVHCHATPPTSRHTAHASPHRTTPSRWANQGPLGWSAMAVSLVDLPPALLAPDARSEANKLDD